MKMLGLFFYIIPLLIPSQLALASSENNTLRIGGRVPFKVSVEYAKVPIIRTNAGSSSNYYINRIPVKNSSSNISYQYVVIGRN